MMFKQILTSLKKSCDDFLYYDPALKNWTVIAGSPHFDQRCGAFLYNWGRDTMISCPGLCLATEKKDVFRSILENYLRFIRNGLLPNFIGDGVNPRYNSVDATFWLFWALDEYFQYTKDYAFLETRIKSQEKEQTVKEILEGICQAIVSGIQWEDTWQEDNKILCAKISIYMDPDDSLIMAGNYETQLTWMDARPKNSLPVTSRHGKAVEINALWYHALNLMTKIFPEKKYHNLALSVKKSSKKFWNPDQKCLYDTIDGEEKQGKKIRPNQIFSVAMGLWEKKESISIMERVIQDLLTPYGLRTLPSYDPDYKGIHTDEFSYHQGTIWPWLTGGFVQGCLVAYGQKKTIQILEEKNYFSTLRAFLKNLESIPEILDGDCQSTDKWNSKGCKKQAWSAAENYRAIYNLQKKE